VRRGAPWPAERPRSRLVVGERKHGWASQRAVARLGGHGGPDAGCAVVTVSAFLSGVRCERPVSGASVRCPVRASGVRGACPSDRCPVRPSECPGVQSPASVVSDGMRSWGEAAGPAAGTAGMAGVGVVARRVHNGASSARGWSLALGAGTGRAGPAAGRLRLGRHRGTVVGQWPGRPGGRLGRRDAGEDRASVGSCGDHAGWSWCGLGRVASRL